MRHAPALLSAATADKAMAWALAGGVLLAIILLARAVGRLSRLASKLTGAAASPAPAPKPSGGRRKLLLAGAAAGGWLWYEGRHKAAATAVRAVPAPSPSPRPTVTQTIAPHAAVHAHPWLTGGDVVALYVIAAVVAIVIGGQVLRRLS